MMRIFVIPSWHPTQTRPTWANWIVPHIDMTKELGEVVVLQVDLDAENSQSEASFHDESYYYTGVPIRKDRWTRTRFFFGSVLEAYSSELEILFNEAVKRHGVPDIIHAHVSMPAGYGAALLGEKFNIPIVVTEHYSGFFSDIRFPWRIEKYYQQMRRKVDGFFVVSPGFKKNIEKKTTINVSGVLPNPINVELFSPSIDKFKRDSVLRLVTTGSICELKGTDVLLNAISTIPNDVDIELTIIGDSPSSTNHAWNLLADHRIKVIPRQPQEALIDYYSNADVFIVSSRIETANVSMLEAMACGCYVISSKIGAPESLLDETVASFFTSEDESELAQLIINVPDFDRAKQRKYVVDNYSKEVVVKRLHKVYRDLL